MRQKRYGLPYMGSKTKIADWVIDCLPPAEHFYDLFCGGCAVTHAAMLRHKYKHYHVNDITDMGMVFRKVIDGDYKPDYRWVSREEFEANKMNDLLMAMCWSFSNNGMDYLYSREREPIKKAAHMAVVFGDYTLADEVGMDLHYLEGIVGMDARYAKYKKNEKKRRGGYCLNSWITSQGQEQSPRFAKHRSSEVGYARLLHLERMLRNVPIRGYMQPREITKKWRYCLIRLYTPIALIKARISIITVKGSLTMKGFMNGAGHGSILFL